MNFSFTYTFFLFLFLLFSPVLIARQFVEVNRARIEGLLSAFPKLIGTGHEHTFIETDNVRYLYKPLEELLVVLVTTKTSNILEDLDTLHLFSRIVKDSLSPLSISFRLQSLLKLEFPLIFFFFFFFF